MNTENSDEYLVQSIFLILIASICLGISWWSMAKGYESFLGNFVLSAAMATTFVLMLAALNFTLRRGLIKGISKGKIVSICVLYVAVVILSFSGMFNKFYSQFMENDLVREEIDQKIDALRELQKNGRAALTNEEADHIRAKVDAYRKELEREILSRTELGIGLKARGILADIQALLELDRPFRIYPTPTKTTDELKGVISLLQADIDSAMQASVKLQTLHSPEAFLYARQLPMRINTQIDQLTNARSAIGAKSTEIDRADGLAVVQKAVAEYKKIGSEISGLVKDINFKYDRNFRVANDRIGEIPHTYESAREHWNRGVVWIAGLVALGLDLIVPVFVFFLTPRSGVRGLERRGRKGPVELRPEH